MVSFRNTCSGICSEIVNHILEFLLKMETLKAGSSPTSTIWRSPFQCPHIHYIRKYPPPPPSSNQGLFRCYVQLSFEFRSLLLNHTQTLSISLEQSLAVTTLQSRGESEFDLPGDTPSSVPGHKVLQESSYQGYIIGSSHLGIYGPLTWLSCNLFCWPLKCKGLSYDK